MDEIVRLFRIGAGSAYVPWGIDESGRLDTRYRHPGRLPLGRRTGPTLGVVRIGHHSAMAERGSLPGQWLIGMSAWVIQDGNYADFSIGQRAEFVLEFYAGEQLRRGGGPAVPVSLGDARYEISATVTTVREEAWVIEY